MSSSFIADTPDAWRVKKFGDLAKITCGVAATPEYVHASEGVPFFSARNVQSEKLDLTKIMHISKDLHKKLTKNTKPQRGDVLLTRVGAGIGEAALVDVDIEFSVYVSLTLIKCGSELDGEFTKYLLNTSFYKSLATRDQFAGGGVQNLNVQMVKAYPVAAPPLPEQKKIAQILSTWDKAISTTEQLLANSQQQKKALMQQLLTGKRRLPGFNDAWQVFAVSEVAEVIVSPVDKKTVEGELPVLLCNYTDVYYQSKITKNIDFMKATAKPREIARFKLNTDDVIITKDSETPGDIAVPALVSEDLGGVLCGYHLAILRPSVGKVDGAFLTFILSMARTRYYFYTLATGATRFGLSVGAINNAELFLPAIEEQKEIAAIIEAAEQQVESLSEQIASLKLEKKALMQQLLTGKRRVNISNKGMRT